MFSYYLRKIIYSHPSQEVRRFFLPIIYLFFKGNTKKSFTFHKKKYHYFDHPYNNAWKNERAVEVPIAVSYLKKYNGKKILEVGNVLSHYIEIQHDVIDKYEPAPGVMNVDVVDFAPREKYDLILCISTLEHVGLDEDKKDPQKTIQAVNALKKILKPGGTLVVTVPGGYNLDLDAHIDTGRMPFTEKFYMKRISFFNIWKQVARNEITSMNYGIVIMCPKVICIGITSLPSSRKKD